MEVTERSDMVSFSFYKACGRITACKPKNMLNNDLGEEHFHLHKFFWTIIVSPIMFWFHSLYKINVITENIILYHWGVKIHPWDNSEQSLGSSSTLNKWPAYCNIPQNFCSVVLSTEEVTFQWLPLKLVTPLCMLIYSFIDYWTPLVIFYVWGAVRFVFIHTVRTVSVQAKSHAVSTFTYCDSTYCWSTLLLLL